MAKFGKGNPHRFKPGESGNPGGRPRTKLISEGYRELLDQVDEKSQKTVALLIAEQVVQKALKGDLAAAREIADRIEGKAAEQMRLDGPGGRPVQIIVRRGA